MSEALFGVLDRVIDTRTGEKATVVAYGLEVGDDGYALVVEYDAEPDVKVSTGSSYFRRDPSVHWEMADNHRHVGYWDRNDGTTRCRNCGADLGTNEEAPSDDPYCALHGKRFDPSVGCIACLRGETRCYSDHNEDIRTKGSCDLCGSTEMVPGWQLRQP